MYPPSSKAFYLVAWSRIVVIRETFARTAITSSTRRLRCPSPASRSRSRTSVLHRFTLFHFLEFITNASGSTDPTTNTAMARGFAAGLGVDGRKE